MMVFYYMTIILNLAFVAADTYSFYLTNDIIKMLPAFVNGFVVILLYQMNAWRNQPNKKFINWMREHK